MLFNSDAFLFLFLPLTLVGYQVLKHVNSERLVALWLIGASLVFYSWWSANFLPLLLLSVLINYVLGTWLTIDRISGEWPRRMLLVLGVTLNLALIGYFKYAGFISQNLVYTFGISVDPGQIILPLAISFFTFQQIAYLVDIYRVQAVPYGFIKYCLYIVFFPQLIAGPIVYHKEFMPQILGREILTRTHSDLIKGITIFLVGLFKKVVIADSLSGHAAPVFDMAAMGNEPEFFTAWAASLAYSFQLYFDFSGYSDMAIGLARMFGIRLPFNFSSPYKACSIIEFWHCWHMTLSRFLRNYLYIPLGGNKKGKSRRLVNLFVTMLLGGLWHGAAWTFVAWGAFHGVLLIINHAWRGLIVRTGLERYATGLFYRSAAQGLTFFSVVVGWVIFRADNFDAVGLMLRAMFGLGTVPEMSFALDKWLIVLIAVSASIAFLAPNSQEWLRIKPPRNGPEGATREETHSIAWPNWRPSVGYALVIAALGFISVHMLRGTSEFLYFQF